MSKTRASIKNLRDSALEMTLRINKLGGVRVLKNDLFMLKHHRNACSDSPTIVANYDNSILAKRWELHECTELESERGATYKEIYLRGF